MVPMSLKYLVTKYNDQIENLLERELRHIWNNADKFFMQQLSIQLIST